MNLNSSPTVSVIMTVFNGEAFVAEAIKSILCQSFVDFEFFIIDDGSSDFSQQIIKNYVALDQRIIPIINERNFGQPLSRNKAIDLARGEFIAIMDADDVALPNRIEKQVNYLRRHPTIGLVSGVAEVIDEKGRSLGQMRGARKSKIECFWSEITNGFSSIVHPTVLIRKSIMDKFSLRYNLETPYAQDKELWSRFLLTSDAVVLPDVLLKYRIHNNSVSSSKLKKQSEYALISVSRMVCGVLEDQSIQTCTIRQMVSMFSSFKLSQSDAFSAWGLRLRLLESIEKSNRFDPDDVMRLRTLEFIRFIRYSSAKFIRESRESGLYYRLRSGVTPWLFLKLLVKNILQKYF